jgi:hypothetical protein
LGVKEGEKRKDRGCLCSVREEVSCMRLMMGRCWDGMQRIFKAAGRDKGELKREGKKG